MAKELFNNLMRSKKAIDFNKIESLSYKDQGLSVYYNSDSKTSLLLLHIAPTLPSGVLFDSGEWIMIAINYFVYHAPWWLGGWSVTYGEHDVINSLYAGGSAQNYYNSVTTATTYEAILDDAAIGVLGVGLGLAAPSIGISALVSAIIAAALVAAGAIISVIVAEWVGKFTSLYESTYANEPAGNKYIWVYDTVDYYYPWINVACSFDSSIGMYWIFKQWKCSNFYIKRSIYSLCGNYRS